MRVINESSLLEPPTIMASAMQWRRKYPSANVQAQKEQSREYSRAIKRAAVQRSNLVAPRSTTKKRRFTSPVFGQNSAGLLPGGKEITTRYVKRHNTISTPLTKVNTKEECRRGSWVDCLGCTMRLPFSQNLQIHVDF